MKCWGLSEGCECGDCMGYRMDHYYPEQEPSEQDYPEEYVQEMIRAHAVDLLGNFGDLSVDEMVQYLPARELLPALNDLQRAGQVTGPHHRFGVSRWRLGMLTKEQSK